MGDLNKLSPAALAAAMRGGLDGWGQCGSIHHVRYCEPITGRRGRRACDCGCKRRSTHVGMANGVALASGCELSMRRWVKDPLADARRDLARRDPRVDVPWNKLDDDGKWVKLRHEAEQGYDIPRSRLVWLLAKFDEREREVAGVIRPAP